MNAYPQKVFLTIILAFFVNHSGGQAATAKPGKYIGSVTISTSIPSKNISTRCSVKVTARLDGNQDRLAIVVPTGSGEPFKLLSYYGGNESFFEGVLDITGNSSTFSYLDPNEGATFTSATMTASTAKFAIVVNSTTDIDKNFLGFIDYDRNFVQVQITYTFNLRRVAP